MKKNSALSLSATLEKQVKTEHDFNLKILFLKSPNYAFENAKFYQLAK